MKQLLTSASFLKILTDSQNKCLEVFEEIVSELDEDLKKELLALLNKNFSTLLKEKEPHAFFFLDLLSEALTYDEMIYEGVSDEELWSFLSESFVSYKLDDSKNLKRQDFKEEFEKEILSFAKFHFSSFSHVDYRPRSELGEDENKLHTQEVPFHKLKSKTLYHRFPSGIQKDSVDIYFKRTHRALNVLEKLTPKSFEAFSFFTDTIVTLEDPNLVSFSFETLPGFSHINFKRRDFVDHLDDIIHENGHHFLNRLLHVSELIDEQESPRFWSAWRESPRPIRGIYHGYCTFFWAHQLFAELFLSFKDSNFTQKEKYKICERFLEEQINLEFSWHQLEYAYENQLITETGWEVALSFKDEFEKNKNENIQNFLEKNSPQSLQELSLHEKSLMQKENLLIEVD